jgi:hypothetical protein
MKAIILVLFVSVLIGCTSIRAAVPASLGNDGEYRELQGDLQRQQADIAVAGQKNEDQGRGLVEDLTRLEDSIARAAPDAGEAEHQYWLSLVQDTRTAAETHVSEIENLNLKLKEERETNRKKDQKFNEYKAAITGELTAMGTENADLRETVKTVKGQRNTLFATILTAIGIMLIIVVVKVLRTLKIIPI